MMATEVSAAQMADALGWKRLDQRLVLDCHRAQFQSRCDALQAYILGASVRHAAIDHGVNRVTLTSVIAKAFSIAPDGGLYGYRACLPWGARQTSEMVASVPTRGTPYALKSLLNVLPEIRDLLGAFSAPLPPGTLPPSFNRLMREIRGIVSKRFGNNCWPLGQKDKGRRAFARYIRDMRKDALVAGNPDATTLPEPKIQSFSQLFHRQPYDRCEFDAHCKDVHFTLEVPNARGEPVKLKISKVWVLVVVEVDSSAVLAWKIVFGRGYTALDVAQCYASSLRPWTPRALCVPDMNYEPGATMPQNLEFGAMSGRVTAMDNALAHKASLPLEAWVGNYDGILHLGKPHTPEGRPAVEHFFNHLEIGALRDLPGGYIPTRHLGEKATPVSEWRSTDHPISFQALEDVMDVIMTSYNITPLPARQNRSPIDILLNYPNTPHFWPSPPHNELDAKALTSEIRTVRLRGSKRHNKPVHVRFMGVVYRHPTLDKNWDLLGSHYKAQIDLEDLRTLVLIDESLNHVCTLTASSPWNIHRHDITMRRRILKLSRSGELEIRGAHSAISAYAAFTLKSCQEGRANAADQIARLMQLTTSGAITVSFSDPAVPQGAKPSMETPLTGRVSFDHVKD